MNPKFSMEDTRQFSEELSSVIRDTWEQIAEANIMTAGDFYISTLRFACRSQDLSNLLGRVFASELTDEQAQNVLKIEVVVDASRHDCFQGDPRYNADDHTFYDDAVGFIYDGYDLLPVFVNEVGVEVVLDPNSGEENMPNLMDIILCAIQQDTATPTITVTNVVPKPADPRTAFQKGLMNHIMTQE